MRVDNVTRGEFDALLKTVRQMQHATPLNNSGMGRGELYVDGGTITIANGGNLGVDGTATVNGVMNVYGPLLVDGPTGINGTLGINGPLDLTGNATVTGDVTVEGGGIIRLGGLILDPNVEGFGGIRSIGTIYLNAPTVATTGQVVAASLLVIGSDVSITALPTTTNPPNLYVDSAGKLFKCV